MTIPDIFLRCMFYIELLFYVIPFILPLARRSLFPLRAVCAAAVWISPVFLWTSSGTPVFGVSVLKDILLFILLNVLLLLCFRCPIRMALYCATGAYAFQQIGLQLNMSLGSGFLTFVHPTPLNIFSYLAVAAVLFFCAYWFFTRTLRKYKDKYIRNYSIAIISLFLVGAISAFNAANNIWLWETPVEVTYVFRVFIVCCCLLTLWQEYYFYQLDRAREEIAVIQQLQNKEQKQMELLRETTDLINIKCHDMKHLLSLIQSKSPSSVEKEIENINDLINIYDFSVDTGSETLNLVLADKGLLCRNENIRLNCIADGSSLSFMEDADIFSLFGNALDNAIRAVRNLQDIQSRVISLFLSRKANLISIRIENYYEGELKLKDGMPVTDQEDTGQHGYGLRSMKRIAEKYGGTMQVEAQDAIFVLSFILEPTVMPGQG